MNFGKNILKYKEDILSDIAKLVEIPSVSAKQDGEAAKALRFVLERARQFGLTAKNIDDRAGHVQLGSGGKLCAAATHLDVVGAGAGWSFEPFALTRSNGRLYGRGVADDKGAAMTSLYCLKALKDAGINGKNTLRAVYGTDEEVGMSDLDYYFSKERLPDLSFTPDSNYGICGSEKGILQVELFSLSREKTAVCEFHSGNAVNAVPDGAYALIECAEKERARLFGLAKQRAGFAAEPTADGIRVSCRGKAAHACEPQKGVNSALLLIAMLAEGLDASSLGSVCGFINAEIGTETDGQTLGIKMSDSVSGELTLNVGTLNASNGHTEATFDIRYPVKADGDLIFAAIKEALPENIGIKILNHTPPLMTEENSPVIRLLSSAYAEITGEAPEVYSTGGGTYARKLGKNSVAFGPVFKGDDCRMHNSDESLDEEKFFLHAQICLQAMYEIYTADI